MDTMTEDEIIAALESLDNVNCEEAHEKADALLLQAVAPAVKDAYEALVDRTADAHYWAFG